MRSVVFAIALAACVPEQTDFDYPVAPSANVAIGGMAGGNGGGGGGGGNDNNPDGGTFGDGAITIGDAGLQGDGGGAFLDGPPEDAAALLPDSSATTPP